ncbi:MAG: hypothetical protein WCD37_20695 [Chloroflexia bacterium]
MDIRNRVMGDKPDSFLHKIAGIIPGFNGYMERERRRDADKLLRTHLAGQYANGRARLTRIQQGMVRGKNLDYIAEVDRIAGVLQRFIDRLNTATYGYTGLFDPVKIEEQDLDMLYAFDMSLTSGVDQVSSAIGALESAVGSTEKGDVSAAINRLSELADDLNLRLNQRQDFISTGRGLPQDEYNSMMSGLNQGMAPPPAAQPGPTTYMPPQTGETSQAGSAYMAPPPPQSTTGAPYGGAPTMPTGTTPPPMGGDMARVQGGAGDMSGAADMGNMQDRPETPRSAASSNMGRLDEMPPVDQWPSAPSPWANKEESDPSPPSGAQSPGMPQPSSGRPGTPSMPSGGSETGSEQPRSARADDFGAGSGKVTGGAYNSAGSAGDDSGIESASSPALPGEDLADKPRLSNDANDLDAQALDDNNRQEGKG